MLSSGNKLPLSHENSRDEELNRLVEDYRSMGERMEMLLSPGEDKLKSSSTPNRRQLLKLSAAAVAGLGATSLLDATPAMASGAGILYLWPGPFRMVDTRMGLGPQPSNTDYVYALANPLGAVYAYVGTVTATNYAGPGYLVVHSSGGRLNGSTLNYGYFSGGAISAFFVCPSTWDAGSNTNRIYVYNYGASTDLIIDLVGYFYS